MSFCFKDTLRWPVTRLALIGRLPVSQRSDSPSSPADLEGATREVALAKAQKEIQGLSGHLANPNVADKAPPVVVVECRANLAEAEAQAELARRRLAELAG